MPDDLARGSADPAARRPGARGERDYLRLPGDRPEPPDAPENDERDAPSAPPDPARDRRRRRLRLIAAAIAGAALVVAAIGFGWYWWTTLSWLESTDDAYTQADDVTIAPKVAGYVTQLLVTDNQRVQAGQVLLRIDPRDYRAAFDKAQADVRAAEADIRSLDAQLTRQQSAIRQAEADVASAEAALIFAQQEQARYQALVKTGTGTLQRAQQAKSDLQAREAALAHNRAGLTAAVEDLAVLKTQRAKADATLQHNRAALAQAQLDLGYTEITAPRDGAVGDRAVREGQYVQAGQRLLTLVPMGRSIYVVANFKETEIERMFRGEAVDLDIDTFPGADLRGTVDSIAPGSGAQFALLPPENATGNFTKIVQRVPVKIRITEAPPDVLRRLRPGLSVTATVDTRTAPPVGKRFTLVGARP